MIVLLIIIPALSHELLQSARSGNLEGVSAALERGGILLVLV